MSTKITVFVYLHSTLVKFSPDGQTRKFELKSPQNSTLGDLITKLGIDPNDEHLLLAVNGKVAEEDQILENQDHVHLMMPISGG
ncbi:MAG: MoaD/ThiS family protein [Anaerolineales bacterium]|jgi:sulfur carrier protein ThiS